MPKSDALAAIDLGSNSFHMVIARQDIDGGIKILDKVKEPVRLGAGLDDAGNLSREAQARALDCLDRFNQRLSDIPEAQVRAVGTNTLRAAHDSGEFLKSAESALGHHISVISGHEEARLVYMGAAYSLAVRDTNRLVIDIGGGSTEMIIGKGYQPNELTSLYMGCVSYTRRFFEDGKITRSRISKARSAALLELETVADRYKEMGWNEAVGTSGTNRALDNLGRSLGSDQHWLSREGMAEIKHWLLDKGNDDALDMVSQTRRSVLAGGFCILDAIFESLDIDRLDTTDGALREGVLYDLNGRLHDADSREQGISSLLNQFKPDQNQYQRVEQSAIQFWLQTKDSWSLNQVIQEKLLRWGARLHEIGFSIAYNQHHKHGAYIIENSDIDGFSRQLQHYLALLVRCHRQKFAIELFETIPADWKSSLIRLTILLRLAVALNRSRTHRIDNDLKISTQEDVVNIEVSAAWCKMHPLSYLDLQSEKDYLAAVGIEVNLIQI